MNELQAVELDLLKKAVAVIEKHHLTYYLIGGTTLGAVRHRGFIPWDDDVDIALPRPDYERFLALASEFSEPYFLQSYKTDPRYPYNFAKLRNSATTFRESRFAHIDMNQGVYIDIFPLDGVTSHASIRRRDRWRIYSVWLRFYIIYLGRLSRPVRARTWYKDLLFNLISLPFKPWNCRHFLNRSIDRTMKKTSWEEARLVANIQGAAFAREIVSKDLFGQGSKAVFEDREFVIEENYDAYLTEIYGDYMTPPPEEKRCGHHYNRGFSLSESYRTFKN